MKRWAPRGLESATQRRSSWVRGASGVLALMVAVLVILSAQATATSIHSEATLRSPFKGTTWGFGEVLLTLCGSWVIPVFPNFNLTSGVFTGAVNASMESCSSTDEAMQLDFSDVFESSKEFSVASDGLYPLTVSAKMSYEVNLTSIVGGAGQRAVENASLETLAYVYNLTSGAQYSIGESSVAFTESSSFVSHSHSFAFTLTNDTQLGTGAEYEVYVEWGFAIQLTVSPGSSTAIVQLNMGLDGRKATLTSITIP